MAKRKLADGGEQEEGVNVGGFLEEDKVEEETGDFGEEAPAAKKAEAPEPEPEIDPYDRDDEGRPIVKDEEGVEWHPLPEDAGGIIPRKSHKEILKKAHAQVRARKAGMLKENQIDETRPGGVYVVDGRVVNAHGDELDGDGNVVRESARAGFPG